MVKPASSAPGVSARKINGLDAYFVSDKMFACIFVIMVIAVVLTEGIRWAERDAVLLTGTAALADAEDRVQPMLFELRLVEHGTRNA